MPMLAAPSSFLLLVDYQTRLMPVIEHADAVVGNARRLLDAATLFEVPTLFTEQNAGGLGPTVPALAGDEGAVAQKMSFDAVRSAGFLDRVPADRAVVAAGCETHVCLLQTVLGLLDAGRRVYVVRDACGSRRSENKETALDRMARHGAEIVTTEMVVFEWLATAGHPRFREALALIK